MKISFIGIAVVVYMIVILGECARLKLSTAENSKQLGEDDLDEAEFEGSMIGGDESVDPSGKSKSNINSELEDDDDLSSTGGDESSAFDSEDDESNTNHNHQPQPKQLKKSKTPTQSYNSNKSTSYKNSYTAPSSYKSSVAKSPTRSKPPTAPKYKTKTSTSAQKSLSKSSSLPSKPVSSRKSPAIPKPTQVSIEIDKPKPEVNKSKNKQPTEQVNNKGKNKSSNENFDDDEEEEENDDIDFTDVEKKFNQENNRKEDKALRSKIPDIKPVKASTILPSVIVAKVDVPEVAQTQKTTQAQVDIPEVVPVQKTHIDVPEVAPYQNAQSNASAQIKNDTKNKIKTPMSKPADSKEVINSNNKLINLTKQEKTEKINMKIPEKIVENKVIGKESLSSGNQVVESLRKELQEAEKKNPPKKKKSKKEKKSKKKHKKKQKKAEPTEKPVVNSNIKESGDTDKQKIINNILLSNQLKIQENERELLKMKNKFNDDGKREVLKLFLNQLLLMKKIQDKNQKTNAGDDESDTDVESETKTSNFIEKKSQIEKILKGDQATPEGSANNTQDQVDNAPLNDNDEKLKEIINTIKKSATLQNGNANVIITSTNSRLNKAKPVKMVHISSIRDLFYGFIKGFKSVKKESYMVCIKGREYSLSENINAFFTCKELNEGVSVDSVEDLKNAVNNISLDDLKNGLKNIIRCLRRIVILIGDRCNGIEDIIDFVDEILIKAKSIKSSKMMLMRNKAYELLSKNSYKIGGFVLGNMLGAAKKFVNLLDE